MDRIVPMSRNKAFRRAKRGSGRHVQLPEWVQATEAWATLPPGPRALYIELKRRYNGFNNGEIFLSHRDAASALNVGRDTVGKYFTELVERGFIIVTRGHCLGPKGIGQAATYALAEETVGSAPATKQFKAWKKQKPRRKIQHSLAGKSDRGCRKIQPLDNQKSENPAALAKIPHSTVLENPAIYTSNHIDGIPQLSVWAGLNLRPLWPTMVHLGVG